MFTQSAFIKKNTQELREKLRDMGYYVPPEPFYSYKKVHSALRKYKLLPELFYSPYLHADHGLIRPADAFNGEGIDCEENEDLFLALAALRDDSDYMQWFWYKDILLKCIGTGSTITMDGLYSLRFNTQNKGYIELMNNCVRKATVEELIEHFESER